MTHGNHPCLRIIRHMLDAGQRTASGEGIGVNETA